MAALQASIVFFALPRPRGLGYEILAFQAIFFKLMTLGVSLWISIAAPAAKYLSIIQPHISLQAFGLSLHAGLPTAMAAAIVQHKKTVCVIYGGSHCSG